MDKLERRNSVLKKKSIIFKSVSVIKDKESVEMS